MGPLRWANGVRHPSAPIRGNPLRSSFLLRCLSTFLCLTSLSSPLPAPLPSPLPSPRRFEGAADLAVTPGGGLSSAGGLCNCACCGWRGGCGLLLAGGACCCMPLCLDRGGCRGSLLDVTVNSDSFPDKELWESRPGESSRGASTGTTRNGECDAGGGGGGGCLLRLPDGWVHCGDCCQ